MSALDQLRLYLDQCPLIAIIRGVTPAETEAIGGAIFSDFVLPFEAVSFLLLAALIGAIVLARKDDA